MLFLVVLFVGDGLVWRRTHQTEATRNGRSRSMNSWINGAHDGSWSTTNENGVTLFWWKTWGYFMLFWCSFSDQQPPPLYLGVPRFGKQSAGEWRSPSFGCVPFAPNYQATRVVTSQGLLGQMPHEMNVSQWRGTCIRWPSFLRGKHVKRLGRS